MAVRYAHLSLSSSILWLNALNCLSIGYCIQIVEIYVVKKEKGENMCTNVNYIVILKSYEFSAKFTQK